MLGLVIQMKATEHYFAVVLFIMLYKVVLTFESAWMKSYGVTIQMKASEQYFPVAVYYAVQGCSNFWICVNEILWCDHSNESYWAVLSCGTVYYAVQGGSNFWICVNEILWCYHSNETYWTLLSHGAIHLGVIEGQRLSLLQYYNDVAAENKFLLFPVCCFQV